MQEKLNVGSKEVFKAASALAAGVAKRGETCGALTGAIMAIDLGKYLTENPVKRIRLCPDCKKFFTHRSLIARFCSEDCHDLYHRKGYGKEYFREAVNKHRRLEKKKRGAIM